MIKPKITKDNYYNRDELLKVVIHYARINSLNLEYTLACFEMFYPFFSCRAHAEEAFESALYQYNHKENRTPLSQIISIITSDIDNFSKHRMMNGN